MTSTRSATARGGCSASAVADGCVGGGVETGPDAGGADDDRRSAALDPELSAAPGLDGRAGGFDPVGVARIGGFDPELDARAGGGVDDLARGVGVDVGGGVESGGSVAGRCGVGVTDDRFGLAGLMEGDELTAADRGAGVCAASSFAASSA